MCLLIFAHNVSPQQPLVIAANRDEFHARPTTASDFWAEYPELLAGRDREQGGTWMGITRQGRFAAITNYRDPARTVPAPRSRGKLPLNYLTGDQGPKCYLDQLAPRAEEYAGFNLLVGDGRDLWYFTNSRPEQAPQRLQPGIYGLSNARLDTPWPKVARGKRKLRELLANGQELDHERLLEVVADRTLADPAALRLQGLAGDMDEVLSAQFIITPRYGTRSSTSLWLTSSGSAHWRELSFDDQGAVTGVRDKNFSAGRPDHRRSPAGLTPPDCG